MRKYIRIMRLDHWIKQFFIVPGTVCALLMTKAQADASMVQAFWVGFFSTCFIASANYVINEYLDAEFDRYHPTKKFRSVVSEDVKGWVVWLLWSVLTVVGLELAYMLNFQFFLMELWLWLMGLAYNVKPIRTKDVAILDVLSESVNNMIRLLCGWFVVAPAVLPPCSLMLGYWMLGAFLMATKRYAEYSMIDDPDVAARYRKSFQFYTEKSLLISAFFYAMCAVFFLGIFLIKYRIELVLIVPFLMGLFCYYFWLSFKEDSAVQKPEKLYHERYLMMYCAFMVVLFVALMAVDLPALKVLTDMALISL